MTQRLGHREVGVGELDVLADDRHRDLAIGAFGALDRLAPIGQLRRRSLDREVVEDEVVDALIGEHERHLVDVVHISRARHGVHRQAREQRDLLADLLRKRTLRAAHQHVRGDTDAPQLVDRVLRRLGLQLARMADVGDEREVDVHAPPPPHVHGELTDRLEERQRLDVTDGAPNLGDDDVDVARLGDQRHALLDLVGDVRNNLHCAPEVVPTTLAPDDRVVDPAGGHVRSAARVRVGEALVMAQVEIGLGAVLGDEHLTVLIRRHRARVDVDVGVELLHRHRQPARDQAAVRSRPPRCPCRARTRRRR